MQLIEASVKFGVRPSAFILGKDSRKPWGKWDILLAEAYQILQDERCGHCGLPRYICHNTSERIQFRIAEDECVVVEKKNSWMKSWESKKENKDKPAPQLRHEAFTVDDSDLSDFRQPYYEDLLAKRNPTPE